MEGHGKGTIKIHKTDARSKALLLSEFALQQMVNLPTVLPHAKALSVLSLLSGFSVTTT